MALVRLRSTLTAQARCRAHFAKTGATIYEMLASCATASAKVDQSAQLTMTGANS